jgi:oxalate decarboxylase/phosphoglucose isomerase-like protein (cupin superfamily)
MTHPVQFVMKPGEVLYLPRGWTHFVENLTPSLMVNTWRRGPAAIIENMNGHHKEAVKKNCF